MSEEAIKIFYSYSRQDLDMRNTLEDHLSTLKRARRIKTWHDLELEAGTEWERDIQEQLNTADIILLLVSRNFIASEYCYSTELERAIARHHAGEARVIPVILRPCDWNHPDVPFSKLNVLPTHAKPITSWTDQDEAFTVVAQRIRETVDQLRAKKLAEQQAKEQQEKPQPAQKEEKQQVERERAQQVTRKELQECDSDRILFIKNVKHPEPGTWAYPLEHMRQTESRTFELMWRASSHGVNQPKAEDLMILHQRAKVTHIVEFLDNQVRETETGFFRRVRAVWLPEQDWNQLPHQKEILGFSPRYADGNTHSLNSPNFPRFREAWSSLAEFQKHIFKHLTQSELAVSDEDTLISERGLDYTKLRDLLADKNWRLADLKTYEMMVLVLDKELGENFSKEELLDFPSPDLKTIDQLWRKYSGNRFGFSVQKQIYVECGARLNEECPDFEIWRNFCQKVGWQQNGNSVEAIFDSLAPLGHLPFKDKQVSLRFAPYGNFNAYDLLWSPLLSRQDL